MREYNGRFNGHFKMLYRTAFSTLSNSNSLIRGTTMKAGSAGTVREAENGFNFQVGSVKLIQCIID